MRDNNLLITYYLYVNMLIRDRLVRYLSMAFGCLMVSGLIIGIDHFSHDRAHFAQLLEEKIHLLEADAESVLRDNDWISQLRSVQNSGKILSNDLVSKIEELGSQPYTIYLYHKDSLIFWSKPGSIIDPKHKLFSIIPCVISDHRQDYYVKQLDIADRQDLLKAYFKIPIVPEEDQAYSIGITPYKFGHPSPDNANLIRSKTGAPIAHVQLLTKEFSFFQQLCILILGMIFFWSLAMAWIHWVEIRPEEKVSHVNKALMQMCGILAIRMGTLFIPYHDFFDQLSLISPIIQDISFPYSITDLLIDSAIFLWLCTLASRIYTREILTVPGSINLISVKKAWTDRIMTMSHYLVVIMMCGLTAWILRQVVSQSNFRLDLGEISLFDIHHFLSIMACGLIVMGVFTFSFQIVTRAIHYTRNFYERMIALLFAGVISIPLLHLIHIDLHLVGFYLGVFILMTLLDLYIDQGNRSVIWVLSWLITISSLTALMLYKYQKDFEIISRTELLQDAPVNNTQGIHYQEQLIEWLYKMPRRYSLAVYSPEGQLAFPHQYDYPLVLQKTKDLEKSKFYEIRLGQDRIDIAMKNSIGEVMLIGKKTEGLRQIVSLFSLIFTVFSFLLFILAGLNAVFEFLPRNMELTISPRPSLRNKIQIAVVFIIILTFVIVGLLTMYYLRSNSRADELRQYDERLRTIAGSIRQSLMPIRSWRDDLRDAARIALNNSAANQIYDKEGNRIPQPEDLKNNSDHIDSRMAFLPKMILDVGSRDYYLSGSHSGNADKTLPGEVGFVSIHKEGKRSGYIELTELFPFGSDIRDPGSAFFMTLLNAYVFIFLIAIGMAVIMARSITGPVAQLSEKLKKIRIGKKNETIQWSLDDEVGELIRDYNAMVTKLDESVMLLAQSERDTAWREMAKQVAHEIKNPLTPMKLSIQYLQNAANRDEDNDLRSMIKRVSKTLIEQIDNLTHIASEFSSYAKMPQAMNEVFVINDIVASVHDLFRKREDMDIQLQVPINDLFVFADKSQIIRVLNNIVKNAIQSIPKARRGLIEIKLLYNDEHVTISIKDNGSGIDEHMREKVFYPNFTTKSSGMGLGLAICADIIQSFDGRIYFETEKGVGTTFFIELPRHQMQGELSFFNPLEKSTPHGDPVVS